MTTVTHDDLVVDVVDEARRGWIHRMTKDRKVILANHLKGLPARERARVIHSHGDGIAEREIDDVWVALGHEPTRDDYHEIAVLLREAADYCDRQAARTKDE